MSFSAQRQLVIMQPHGFGGNSGSWQIVPSDLGEQIGYNRRTVSIQLRASFRLVNNKYICFLRLCLCRSSLCLIVNRNQLSSFSPNCAHIRSHFATSHLRAWCACFPNLRSLVRRQCRALVGPANCTGFGKL